MDNEQAERVRHGRERAARSGDFKGELTFQQGTAAGTVQELLKSLGAEISDHLEHRSVVLTFVAGGDDVR